MPNAVALFRGINVGGHRITNVELVAIVESLGFNDVAAYQASGNVLFDIQGRTTEALEHALEEGLAGALGYLVPTTIRVETEIRDLLSADPHAAAVPKPAGKPQIAFFKTVLPPAQASEIKALAPKGDDIVVLGREVYWWPNGGLSDTSLDWAAVDRHHGPLTMRTRGTVERIVGRLSPT